MTHLRDGIGDGAGFRGNHGDGRRFASSAQAASYAGFDSAQALRGRQAAAGRLHQACNCFPRQLVVEAVQTTSGLGDGLSPAVPAALSQECKAGAKLAAARRLTVRLFWVLKAHTDYPEIADIESYSPVPMRPATPTSPGIGAPSNLSGEVLPMFELMVLYPLAESIFAAIGLMRATLNCAPANRISPEM